MPNWPHHPVIYEINTWVWLEELKSKTDASLTLATVPAIRVGCDCSTWSDRGLVHGRLGTEPCRHRHCQSERGPPRRLPARPFRFPPEDNVGSPYCVRRYVVDEHLGGREGLAIARRRTRQAGAQASSWISSRTMWRRTIRGYPVIPSISSRETTTTCAGTLRPSLQLGGEFFACGRDPYFPAWPDVLQLNAFQPELRQAVIVTLSDIAGQSDGVRCDMAMLLMNSIFERTWGDRAGGQARNRVLAGGHSRR